MPGFIKAALLLLILLGVSAMLVPALDLGELIRRVEQQYSGESSHGERAGGGNPQGGAGRLELPAEGRSGDPHPAVDDGGRLDGQPHHQ